MILCYAELSTQGISTVLFKEHCMTSASFVLHSLFEQVSHEDGGEIGIVLQIELLEVGIGRGWRTVLSAHSVKDVHIGRGLIRCRVPLRYWTAPAHAEEEKRVNRRRVIRRKRGRMEEESYSGFGG